MKKLLFSLVLSTFTLLSFAQADDEPVKKEKLTPIEIEINKGGFLFPDLGVNFYLTEKTILRVQSFDGQFFSFGNNTPNSVLGLSTFLEFRKFTGKKLFLSHGPTTGYAYKNNNDIKSHAVKVGYNFGVGYQISDHLTGGTYISPYVSYEDNQIDVLHGRLFSGALSNIYLAYRF